MTAGGKGGHRLVKALGIVLGIVLVLALAFCGYVYYRTGAAPWTASPKTLAANAALKSVDLGSVVDAQVDAHRSEIAATLGVSEDQVDEAVQQLDVSSWQVVDQPSGLTAVGTYDTTYQGQPVTLTLYDDPGYVSANMGGTDLTFAVPESAQSYVTTAIAAS